MISDLRSLPFPLDITAIDTVVEKTSIDNFSTVIEIIEEIVMQNAMNNLTTASVPNNITERVSFRGISFPFECAFKSLEEVKCLLELFQWMNTGNNVHLDIEMLTTHLGSLAQMFDKQFAIAEAVEDNSDLSRYWQKMPAS